MDSSQKQRLKNMEYNAPRPEEFVKIIIEALERLRETPDLLSLDESTIKQIMSLKAPEKSNVPAQSFAQPKFLTSFGLNWNNCSCSDADAPAHEELTVYTYDDLIVWRQSNGYKQQIQVKNLHISHADAIRLRTFFDGIFGTYYDFEERNRLDFRVPVCDGPKWRIRVSYSRTAHKEILGNVEMPPYGSELVALLKEIISHYDCEMAPAFFGIS